MNEENVLFNDALNTFYLGLYGVGHNYAIFAAKDIFYELV